MEQRAWAYVVGVDGDFCVGSHRGNDLESFIAQNHGDKRSAPPILWAETFRNERAATAFLRRFRRMPYRRQAQMIIADQIAA